MWRVEVITGNSGKWQDTECRFDTPEDAIAFGKSLVVMGVDFRGLGDVTEYRAVNY